MAKLEERLRYIIEAIWKGEGATAAASRDISGIGKASKTADLGLGNLIKTGAAVGVALGAVAITARQVYQAFGEGAELELAADRFDKLTASIGTTSEALLKQMETATAGMVSNADMIASASQIISLGLADNAEDVTRLANLISQLGWDMQQVIMTFANDSKMRLDALGLSVEDVEERMKALTDAGMDAGRAFDLAVIEAGEEKLQLLGSAADTAVGDMRRLEASWEDLTNAGKILLAQVLTPMVSGLANLVGPPGESGAPSAFDLAEEAGSVEEYLDLLRQAGISWGTLEQATEWFTQGQLQRAAEGADVGMLQLERAVYDVADAIDTARSRGRGGGLLGGLFADAQQDMGIDQEAIAAAERAAAEMAEAAARSLASTFQQSLQSEGGLNIPEMLFGKGVELGLDLPDLALLGEDIGIVGDKLREAAVDALVWQEAMRLMGQVDDGKRSIESMKKALEDFRAELENWELSAPAKEVSTAGEDIKRATLGMEGISTTGWTNRVIGPMGDASEAAGTAATALGTLQTAMLEVDGMTAEVLVKDNAGDATENADKFRRYWDENMAAGFHTTATISWVTEGMPPPGAPEPPGRAWGGPVSRGSAYVVGEKGPEVFVPSSSGWIVPNGDAGRPAMWSGASAGRPVMVNNNFNGLGVGASVAVARRVLANYTRGTR